MLYNPHACMYMLQIQWSTRLHSHILPSFPESLQWSLSYFWGLYSVVEILWGQLELVGFVALAACSAPGRMPSHAQVCWCKHLASRELEVSQQETIQTRKIYYLVGVKWRIHFGYLDSVHTMWECQLPDTICNPQGATPCAMSIKINYSQPWTLTSMCTAYVHYTTML